MITQGAVITSVIDDYGPSQGIVQNMLTIPAPQGNIYTDDNTPYVNGTAEPGTTVDIIINGGIAGQVVSDSYWQWSYQSDELSSGLYSINADQEKFSGPFGTFGYLFESNTYQFVISRQLTPVITSITTGSGGETINVEDGGRTDGNNPTIHGTAEPGSIISIFDNGIKIGETSTTSDFSIWNTPDGWSWSFTPNQPLSINQTHVFTVASRNLSLSNISMETTPSDYSYTIGIGVTPAQPDLLAPVITSVVDDVGANQGAVADGGQTNDVRPTLHGTSEPGTVVTVSDNGHVIGTATTGADWQWTFTPGADLAAGTNTLSVSAARADGTGTVAAWYTHGLDVTPSLDAVLANAGLSAAPAAAAPTVQAAYVSPVSEATHAAAVVPVHDLAY